MGKNTVAAVLFTTGAVFGLTACGGEAGTTGAGGAGAGATSRPQSQAPQDKKGKDAQDPAKDAPERKKDVKITACKSGGGDTGVSAVLEVTNSLDEPMEYIAIVVFRDPSGAELTKGTFNTGTLQPGEKASEEIQGPNVYTVVENATCEVSEVELDEPV